MREAARAEYQHPLIAQRRKQLARLEMVLGAAAGLHRKLQQGNVRIRPGHDQRHLCAMVEAAAGIYVAVGRPPPVSSSATLRACA